jgi:hypothetical protein
LRSYASELTTTDLAVPLCILDLAPPGSRGHTLLESKVEAHEGEDTPSVSKAEYVLSVLLRLGKLDYDADVHLWAQVCAVHCFSTR